MDISRELWMGLGTDWAVLGDGFVSGGPEYDMENNRDVGDELTFGNRG